MCCCDSCARPCTALRTSHHWAVLTALPLLLLGGEEVCEPPTLASSMEDGFWHSRYGRVLAAAQSSGTPAQAHTHRHVEEHTTRRTSRQHMHQAICTVY